MIKNHIRNNTSKYILHYSLVMVLFFAAFVGYYRYHGKLMITFGDGTSQHYQALYYYSVWLRAVIKNIITSGEFIIPTYTFGLGYGEDIVTTLHYYAIGDPFNVFSIFVPGKYIYLYYEIIEMIRVYMVGISFIIMYQSVRQYEDCYNLGVVAGAITYAVNGYVLYIMIAHPIFISAMVWLPLIIAGIEKILSDTPPHLFIITTSISIISNFYQFYIIVVFSILYYIWRIVFYYKSNGKAGFSIILRK